LTKAIETVTLKKMRKAKGLTQKECAWAVGVSWRAYSYWESGDRKIHPDKIRKLADFLNVSPYSIFILFYGALNGE